MKNKGHFEIYKMKLNKGIYLEGLQYVPETNASNQLVGTCSKIPIDYTLSVKSNSLENSFIILGDKKLLRIPIKNGKWKKD